MKFAQIRDRVEIDREPPESLEVSGLIGTWVNSNPDTTGIARMIMTKSGDRLSLQTYAIGPNGLIDWATTAVTLFSAAASSRVAAGFTCLYDFGFAETRLQGMIMKGLLVLAQFHTFKDNSGRVGYFVREYYSLDHGRLYE